MATPIASTLNSITEGEFHMSEWTQTRAPTHPGAILREDVLPALGMTVTGVAKALDVSRQQVHRIMAETAPVTPEMALRLGKFCGNGPDLWLRMQASYDLWNARRDLEPEIERIPTGGYQIGMKKAGGQVGMKKAAAGWISSPMRALKRTPHGRAGKKRG
jgi:addiction module HigA family antidote